FGMTWRALLSGTNEACMENFRKYFLVDFKYENIPGFITPYGTLVALKARFPILISAPSYPLPTQVKLVVAACALHVSYKITQLDESTVQPVGFEKPEMMTNADSQMMAADLPFDIQQIEGASKLRDTIATEIWNDYVLDFPIRKHSISLTYEFFLLEVLGAAHCPYNHQYVSVQITAKSLCSVPAYRLEEDQRHEEEDQRHEERIRRYDELKNLLLSLIQKSSSPSPNVYGKGNDTWADAGLKHGSYFLFDRIPEDGWYFHDESRLSKKPLCRSNLEVHLQFHVDRLETGNPQKPTECASSYGDFGCLSPNNMTDFEEDEKVFENTRSVTKEDKDEQGKEEKGVVNYFEVGT
ncbi:hypothetical protein Tco_0784403, partial [Tanacetum coccineum]